MIFMMIMIPISKLSMKLFLYLNKEKIVLFPIINFEFIHYGRYFIHVK